MQAEPARSQPLNTNGYSKEKKKQKHGIFLMAEMKGAIKLWKDMKKFKYVKEMKEAKPKKLIQIPQILSRHSGYVQCRQ